MLNRPTPTEPEARAAYETELDVCFIVRMPRALRADIEAHAAWLAARHHLDHVSLAAAGRDLFRRGLNFSPAARRARRRARASGQLEMFSCAS